MLYSMPSPRTTRTGSPGSACASNRSIPRCISAGCGNSTPNAIPFPQALIEVAPELPPDVRSWAEETASRWF